jgi:hypothetical protein
MVGHENAVKRLHNTFLNRNNNSYNNNTKVALPYKTTETYEQLTRVTNFLMYNFI